MSIISLNLPHGLSRAEAAGRLRGWFHETRRTSAYLEDAEVEWLSDTACTMSGEGFSARVEVLDTAVRMELQLDEAMSVFRALVEEKAREMLQAGLASAVEGPDPGLGAKG